MPGGGQELKLDQTGYQNYIQEQMAKQPASFGAGWTYDSPLFTNEWLTSQPTDLYDPHQFWSPAAVRASMMNDPTRSSWTANWTPSDEDVRKLWIDRNRHAQRYRTDPAYKREWDRSHGGGLEDMIEAPHRHLQMALEDLEDNPERALIGAGSEYTTDLWNSLLGTDYDALATPSGGATDEQLVRMQTEYGISNPDAGYQVADTAALMASMMAANNALNAPSGGSNALNAPAGATNYNPTNALANPPGTFTGGNVAAGTAATTAGTAAANNAASNAPSTSVPSSSNTGDGMNQDLWNNLLNLGSSVASGYFGHQATEEGINEIARQYDISRADFAPWRAAGAEALGKLRDFNIEDDPIYQFQRDEGLRAVERAMAARGMNNSGNLLNELNDRAIGMAGQYQNDAWNRLAGLAGVGQAATSTTAGLGANAASNLANLYLQQGQAYNNAVQGGLNNYFMNQYLRN